MRRISSCSDRVEPRELLPQKGKAPGRAWGRAGSFVGVCTLQSNAWCCLRGDLQGMGRGSLGNEDELSHGTHESGMRATRLPSRALLALGDIYTPGPEIVPGERAR